MEEASSSSLDLLPLAEVCHLNDQESSDESSSDEEAEDDDMKVIAEQERPEMTPIQAGAQVFVSGSTQSSRTLAAQVKQVALQTSRVHGTSSVGTPWIYARRLAALRSHNKIFLAWCRSWIEEIFDVDPTAIRAPRTEPHIVKYNHDAMKHSHFKGLGTHQDGSFVTCIMALSDPDEYSGGGTYFAHLGQTVSLGLGEVLLFQGQQGPYSAPHRAVPIASGKRVLYLAFFKLRKKKRKGGSRRGTSRAGTPRTGMLRTGTPRAGMLRRAVAG